MSDKYNMDRVVEHTKGLMDDNELSKGEAAAKMADCLNGLDTKDIIEEM